jgi:hypothetical protein
MLAAAVAGCVHQNAARRRSCHRGHRPGMNPLTLLPRCCRRRHCCCCCCCS